MIRLYCNSLTTKQYLLFPCGILKNHTVNVCESNHSLQKRQEDFSYLITVFEPDPDDDEEGLVESPLFIGAPFILSQWKV